MSEDTSSMYVALCGAMKSLYPRLYDLAVEMRHEEGYFKNSRSWRNNNPGNLRGTPLKIGAYLDDDNYLKFPDYHSGMYAMLFDLHCKCFGKTSTGLGPDSSLGELIHAYAPAADSNNPVSYAGHVAARLDVKVETRLAYFVGL